MSKTSSSLKVVTTIHMNQGRAEGGEASWPPSRPKNLHAPDKNTSISTPCVCSTSIVSYKYEIF